VNGTIDAPGWFVAAMGHEPEHRDVEVAGCRIHCRLWGRAGDPVLLLVHGGAAHSGWWDHIGPFLTAGRRVVAADLSGHGDSARRASYGMSAWAAELAAVIATLESGPAVVVGHSMGGRIAVTLTAQHPEAVSGLIIIDSPLQDLPPDEERISARRRPTRIYPTPEEAYPRFVTLPPQDVILPYVRENIVRQSLRQVEGGWTWKFDPQFFGSTHSVRPALARIARPALFLRCEYGIVGLERVGRLVAECAVDLPIVELPSAGHHPMLDQPLPLVAAIRTATVRW
jgi:pimeloyl-ACP methyl ester carboxylesterase